MADSPMTPALLRPPATLLQRASSSPQVNCDGVGSFTCGLGTCYTGGDGFIGCCSVSSCAARTTCMPFVPGSAQTCDTNTGGCVLCSSNAPYCVTITNVVAKQHIMYCDTKSAGTLTYSYENLVSTGSMALPPALATVSTSAASPSDVPHSVPATQTSQSITSTGAASSSSSSVQISSGVIAGISVASVIALVAVSILIMGLLRKRHKNIHPNRYEKSNNGSGDSHEFDSSLHRSSFGKRLKKSSSSTSKFGILRTYANDTGTYLSPLDHDRMARVNEACDAARVHELDSAPITPNDPERPEHDNKSKADWWKPPVIATPGPQKPSTRWSVNAAPMTYKAYQPNEAEPMISELSSSRNIIPTGDKRLSQPSTANADGVSPITDYSNPSSPVITVPARPNTVFALTPLMTRFQTEKPSTGDTPIARFASQNGNNLCVPGPDCDMARRSSGTQMPYDVENHSANVDPAARVAGPLTWPEPLNLRRKADRPSSNDSVKCITTDDTYTGRHSQTVTSSNGDRCKYVSPEIAMTDGFTADVGDEDEIAVASVVSLKDRAHPREIVSVEGEHGGVEVGVTSSGLKKKPSDLDGFDFRV